MRHLILGAGPAGVVAAETLRKADPAASIAVVGDEPEPPYARMAIPYLLKGTCAESDTHLRKEPGHFERLGIDLIRARAETVDTRARSVRLAGGSSLDYDRLLIATGAHALRPAAPGMDLPDVHACWTLEDARRILARTRPGSRAVLIGAGFIGCILLEALARRGVRLTVVEMGERMVPRMLPPAAAEMLRRWCAEKGVRVLPRTQVASVEAGGEGMRARLSSGEALDCDVIISASGVRPNIAFLAGSGIATARGVLADAGLRTSVAGVFAAGDVAEAADFHTGEPSLNAIQPDAVDQGRVAGLNMAGGKASMAGSLAINILDTVGLVTASFGQWAGRPGGDSVELKDDARFRCLTLQFAEDVLVGATCVGLTEHVGILRGLIQSRVRLGPWKERLLRDPTQVMQAYLARAQQCV